MNDSRDDRPDEYSDEPERNPLEEILSAFLGPEAAAEAAKQFSLQGFDLSSMADAFGAGSNPVPLGQLQYLFQSTTGPINWRMVEDLAKQHAFQADREPIGFTETRLVNDALQIADLWLSQVTDFTVSDANFETWIKVDWVTQTLPAWKQICEPVAANASRALTEALQSEMGEAEDRGLPPEIQQLAGSLSTALPRMSGLAFGSQIGQALGAMSEHSFGPFDSGLPLARPGTTALVFYNIMEFTEGLTTDPREVLWYIAIRESAHSRLFASVPWLQADLLQAITRYSQEIRIDTEAIAESARSFDFQDPESLNRAMSEGVFSPEPTEAQQRALTRIETLLALIEGWVEVVTAEAGRDYLPDLDKMQELMRRRRVSGSNGEQLLAQLVGLHLRPRQARNAAKLWRLVQDASGPDGRDALWAHPDLIPTAQELADPEIFLATREAANDTTDEFDEALEKLLDGTLGWADGLEPPTDDK
ncbi:zinc-dependent metalloprotease [Scrofimicrobium sp. R131]|uniref:Zinc-dependent metalloprotease n=1 Tax=Scrofimicrobium appendicitidis TaxID=3079930 RepID=A0AAU7V887_9ACTO